jgi:hypothetical protein
LKFLKRYDKAKTSYRRLINCETFSDEQKEALMSQYNKLDPLTPLKTLQEKHEEFWRCTWGASSIKNIRDVPKEAYRKAA